MKLVDVYTDLKTAIPMLYQLYETQRGLMEPFAEFAKASSRLFGNNQSPFSYQPGR
mgnify:CR=1 FL=1